MNKYLKKIFSKKAVKVRPTKMEERESILKRIWMLRLPVQDQILFAKRLGILIRAGIPILDGLQMLRKQTRSKSSAKIMDVLISDVENGQYISTSMGQFRKIFGEFAINIVAIGEVSGTLHENLNYLAEELKKKQMLKRKVFSALLYPMFIVFATLGITILLTVYLFPKILPVFSSFNFKLPWTTKTLIFISNALTHYGGFIFLGLIALSIATWLALKNKDIALWVERQLIRIPVMGNLIMGYNLANLCRTLGLLLKSSVPIVKATSITAGTTVNLAYRQELTAMADHITKGDKIATHFAKNPGLFPPVMQQMVAVGEQAGNLSEALTYLADMYENEVED